MHRNREPWVQKAGDEEQLMTNDLYHRLLEVRTTATYQLHRGSVLIGHANL